MVLAISSRRVIIALLALVGLAAAGAERASEARAADALRISSFKLPGSNGFSVEAVQVQEGGRPADTAIVAERGRVSASYEVSGDLAQGMHATFGALGAVDVRFHRRDRFALPIDVNCRAVLEEGVFRGEFSFAGEGGYTAASAGSALGTVISLKGRGCEEESAARRNTRRRELDHAVTLSARARLANGSVELEASRTLKRGLELEAVVSEKLGPVSIRRRATAKPGTVLRVGGGKSPRLATLRASRPFQGTARYSNPRGGKPRWLGSLRVTLPGRGEVSLAGLDFTARVCRGARALRLNCRARRPAAPSAFAQISGSQSQDLGEARLSWSR